MAQNHNAQVCPYCGNTTCAMLTGSSEICEPNLYGARGPVSRAFADLIRREWGDIVANSLEVEGKGVTDS